MKTPEEKLDNLRNILIELESVILAYSGGVDSTFLLKAAHDVLGDNLLAVTSNSESVPARDLEDAQRMIKKIGARHLFIRTDEIEDDNYNSNPANRCYFCKKELFSKLDKIACEKGIKHVIDAANFDDVKDYRPGRIAANELSVRSPLVEAEITKDDLRELSRAFGLETWNKPSSACLSSRIPYGENINPEKLKAIDLAEIFLRGIGISQVRVRHHGEIARIEVEKDSFGFVVENSDEISDYFKTLGFKYVALDLKGYRSGSMNEIFAQLTGKNGQRKNIENP